MSARIRGVLPHLVLALVAYVPLLLTAPGRIAADTKTYLYLDPGRLLARAPSMWDPNVGLGTVTHQTIGYLWPMGPWFWAFEQLGVPDWVAQRLWVGTLLLGAGAGVLFLLRTLGVARHLPLVGLAAALVYALSPYVLHYAARISVILLPWAVLPWLVALTERALRTGSWRHPALFALLVATAGGVNATALVLAGLGPLLWLVLSTLQHRDVTWRAGLATALRIGSLTLLCSLWWLSGLLVQGSHGIDILRYTETVETVARTSLSSEVLRGLGYWFFYGGDKLGPWIEPGRSYTQHLWLIGVGFVLPAAALVAAVLVRWRHRLFAVASLLLGTAVAVGAYAYRDPSPIGALFKAFARSSTAGLALRSTPRAIPLVVLAVALLVAAGLAASAARRPRAATAGAVLAGLVAAAGIPPLWTGDFIGENLQRPPEVPAYWEEAAAWLDRRDDGTRVLEIPGTDFASYRWGNTVDPILPGLIDRPYAARELIPYGSEASADLLAALDRRLQEGVFEPDALAPVARLLAVGDVVLRSDLQYERYRTPRPRTLWALLSDPTPPGIGEPVGFGDRVPNQAIPELPLRDEIFLATPADVPDPAPVTALPVLDPLPIVRARAAGGVLLAGDGEGVVDAAAAGLLDDAGVLRYAAALRPAERRALLRSGTWLVVTDTNRKRARRWSTVRENTGYTERAGEEPLVDDPSDNRLPLFPDAPDDDRTTVEQRGVRRVQASDYGNPVSYTPEDRPANAFDGDVTTAWRTGAFDGVRGERLELETTEPVTTDTVNVVQPVTGPRNRFITRLAVVVDGEEVGTFDLDDRSRTPKGQDLDFGRTRRFRELALRVEGDNVGKRALYDGFSGVGLAEVRVDDVRLDEVVRLPDGPLRDAGAGTPLTLVLTRLRANPQEPVRNDEERALVRAFHLPQPRSFALRGSARLAAGRPDEAVDALLGRTGPTARSSRHLPGDLTARAAAAVDGDPTTAWTNGFGEQVGDWLEVELSRPGVEQVALTLLADGFHSVPTRVVVSTEAGDRHVVDLPRVRDGSAHGATTTVPLRFPSLRGRVLRLTVEAVRPVTTIDWFSGERLPMPVAVAEVTAAGLGAGTLPARLPGGCRNDLLAVDGRAVPVRFTGATADAVRRQALEVEACGPPVRLAEGDHELRAAPGLVTGIDLDRIVLSDGASAAASARVPRVAVEAAGRTSFRLRVSGATEPFWLVLGQSHSPGWEADAAGVADLGEPQIVDGYANGWLVDPPDAAEFAVDLEWTPQRRVDLALWASAAGALLCLVVALLSFRRRRPLPAPVAAGALPRLRPRWSASGAPPSLVVTAAAALGVGVAAGLVVHPVFGAIFAVLTALSLRLPHGRAVGALAPLLLVAAAVFTAGKQWRNGYPPDFGWADFFRPAHYLAWGALWVVVVVILTDRLRPSTDNSQGPPLDAHRAPPG